MDNTPSYESLDPENWEEMRTLAHHMVDDALTYLETVRERPVWQRDTGSAITACSSPVSSALSRSGCRSRNTAWTALDG